jgi:hypothetical protein
MRKAMRGVWLSAAIVAAPCVVGCAAGSGGGSTESPLPATAAASAATAAAAPTSSAAVAGAAPAATTTGVHGKLLYSIARGPDHKIEFYELEHGETAAHESLVIGDRAELEAIDRPMALADIFHFVEPSRAVPQAIVDADAHVAAFRATQPPAKDQAESHGGSAAPLVSSAAAGDEHADKIDVKPLTTSCSPDYNGDGWWGQGFLNSYCTNGSYRFCQQNWGSAYHYDQGSWFQWNQMEGDWNLNGHTTGYHEWFSCSWPSACGESYQTDWDYDVLPRHIEIWTYGDAGGSGSSRGTHGASGSSQCGHLHIAALYNN